MANEVEIVIKGKDEASKVFKGIGSSITSLGTVAIGALAGLGALAAGAATGILALAASAEPLVGLQQGFATVTDRIGVSSEPMLAKLQEASNGLIDNRSLMQSFNKAAALVSDDFANTLPDAMSLVQKASLATGQDMGFLFDSLVTGIGRVSPMILDNLGIQVQLSEVTERAAEMFGKTTEELSKQEQQAALTEIVMEKLSKTYGDVPDVTNTFGKLKPMLANLRDEIGLKLLPVIQPLLARIIQIAQDALPIFVNILKTKVIPVIGTITDFLGRFLDKLLTFPALLEEGFTPLEAMAEILKSFLPPDLAPTVDKIVEGIQNFIATITNALAPIIEAVTNFVSFKDVLIALGIVIAAVIIPLIVSLVTTMAPVIAIALAIIGVIALLRNAWENNWGGIQEKTRAVIDFLKNAIGTFLAAIQNFWKEHGEKIMSTVSNAWNTIKAIVSTVIDWISNAVKVFLDAVKSFWDAHGVQIMTAVSNIWETLKTIINTAIEYIKLIVKIVLDAIHGDWRQFGEDLRTLVDTLWEDIKSIFSKAWDSIKTIVSNLIDNIKSFFKNTDWGAVGRGIIEGIANGISSAVSWLVDKAVAAAKAAVDAVKGFLHMKSPSKVFVDIGRNMMQGWAQGINQSASLPALASVGAASNITHQTIKTMNVYPTFVNSNAEGAVNDLKFYAKQYGMA